MKRMVFLAVLICYMAIVPVAAQSLDANFTSTDRWATFGLNYLVPGLGSFVIMKDNVGGWTQVGLTGGGVIMMLNGISVIEEELGFGMYTTTVELNALFYIGLVSVLGSSVFNIYRSATYNKPASKTAAAGFENFNFAIVPDRHGNIKTVARYRLSF